MAENKKGKLYVVADAHLDTQWNWDIQDTIRDCVKNTLVHNFKLIKKYPDYKFNFEGAFRYKLAKEYYPKLYEELRTYVDNGSWNVCGSSWDACDVNVPSSEALMRQVLYGNGFFEREFGKKSTDIFLVDCFGFPYSLPSVEAHMGLKGFSTQKLSWGLGTPVIMPDGSVHKPYKGDPEYKRMDFGRWKGIDGNEVFVYLEPGGYGYNFEEGGRNTTPINKRENYRDGIAFNEETAGIPSKVVYYGTGDYGGGPEESSVKMVEDAVNSEDGDFEVVSATADQIFSEITPEQKEKMPVYDGELLIPHGYGTFTSRAIHKRWNRRNELTADEAEKANIIAETMGSKVYPKERLRTAWETFLWHQFHDDLPGTSIPRAYQFTQNDDVIALNMFRTELESGAEGVAKNLNTNVKGTPVVVFNPVSAEVTELVKVEMPRVKKVTVFDGEKELPAQVENGVVKFVATLPSVGFKVFDVRESASSVSTGLKVATDTLENERYIVKINTNGDISSVYDKKNGKELLAEPVHFEILPDNSHDWPSWEIPYEDFIAQPVLIESKPEISIVADGPAVVTLRIVRTFEKSVFTQEISLTAGGNRVDVYNKVDWCRRSSMLKAAFPLAVSNPAADFDLGLGAITRTNSVDPSYYEYSNHQWTDLTSVDGTYGVAIINDCKYGIDKPNDNTLRLTCLNTPEWGVEPSNQSYQDIGTNIFSFALFGHEGYRFEVPGEAAVFNQQPVSFISDRHDGLFGSVSFVSLDTNKCILKCVKKEEKGDRVIVRVQEISGKGSDNVKLTFAYDLASVQETNGYEDFIKDIAVSGRTMDISMKPYQVRTFAVTLSCTKADNMSESVPVEIPFNKCVVTSNDKRWEHSFINGISIPAEMYSDSFTVGGVDYRLGKAESDNAVTCCGQKIALPENTDKVFVLAASMNGDKQAEFKFGKDRRTVTVQDFSEKVGVWDSVAAKTVAKIKNDKIAQCYTHTHDGNGDRLYEFAYLFIYEFDSVDSADLVLPDDDDIVVMAVSAVRKDGFNIKLSCAVGDRTVYDKLYRLSVDGKIIGHFAAGKCVRCDAEPYTDSDVFVSWSSEYFGWKNGNRAIVVMPAKDLDLKSERMHFDEDFAKNRPCTVSGSTAQRFSWLPESSPTLALNGKIKGRWESEEMGETLPWMEIDLEKTRTISKYFIFHCGQVDGYLLNTKSFRIEYRNSKDEDWVTAVAYTDNTEGITSGKFEPVKARYVRLVISEPNRYGNKIARIHMFKIG